MILLSVILPKLALILLFYTFFSTIELLIPASEHSTLKERGRNITFMLIYLIIGGSLTVFILDVIPPFGQAVAELTPLLKTMFVLLYLFMLDVLFYWYHRIQHAFTPLWRVHELHHSDQYLNSTSSLRSNFLEYPLQTLFVSMPVFFLLGSSAELVITIFVIHGLFLIFSHANIKVHLGPLTPILVGPQVHRIHHSIEETHQNTNFAQIFPIIDIIFGTYYHPNQNEFPSTGVKSMASTVSILDGEIRPFHK